MEGGRWGRRGESRRLVSLVQLTRACALFPFDFTYFPPSGLLLFCFRTIPSVSPTHTTYKCTMQHTEQMIQFYSTPQGVKSPLLPVQVQALAASESAESLCRIRLCNTDGACCVAQNCASGCKALMCNLMLWSFHCSTGYISSEKSGCAALTSCHEW